MLQVEVLRAVSFDGLRELIMGKEGLLPRVQSTCKELEVRSVMLGVHLAGLPKGSVRHLLLRLARNVSA